MKIYLGYNPETQVFYKFKETREDNEFWYQGDNLSNVLKVYMDFTPGDLEVYPTLNITDARGRSITNVLFDNSFEQVEEDNKQYFVATFTLTGNQLHVSGRTDITIVMNKDNVYKKSVCNIAVELQKSTYLSDDLLVIGNNPDGNAIYQSFKALVDKCATVHASTASQVATILEIMGHSSSIGAYEARITDIDSLINFLNTQNFVFLPNTAYCLYHYESNTRSSTDVHSAWLFPCDNDNAVALVGGNTYKLSHDIWGWKSNKNVIDDEVSNFTDYHNFYFDYTESNNMLRLVYDTFNGIYTSAYQILPTANVSRDGLMSKTDVANLNALLDFKNKTAEGAEVNVQSDWNVTDTSSDAYIQNKPNLSDMFSTRDARITALETRANTMFEIVTELPNNPVDNKIYMLANAEQTEDDMYQEYIYKDNRWEVLGSKKLSINIDELIQYNVERVFHDAVEEVFA